MYKIENLETDHQEAYRKITDLLQRFMDYQHRLRKMRNDEYQFEISLNSYIINYIHWVRYHLMGCGDIDIIKKSGVNKWAIYTDRPWVIQDTNMMASQVLGIGQGRIEAKELIGKVIDYVDPHDNGIFSKTSMSLRDEIERMRKKIDFT